MPQQYDDWQIFGEPSEQYDDWQIFGEPKEQQYDDWRVFGEQPKFDYEDKPDFTPGLKTIEPEYGPFSWQRLWENLTTTKPNAPKNPMMYPPGDTSWMTPAEKRQVQLYGKSKEDILAKRGEWAFEPLEPFAGKAPAAAEWLAGKLPKEHDPIAEALPFIPSSQDIRMAGGFIDSMFSPVGLATVGTGAVEAMAGKGMADTLFAGPGLRRLQPDPAKLDAFRKIASTAGDLRKAGSASFSGHGLGTVVDPDTTWEEKAGGGIEAILGALGTRGGVPKTPFRFPDYPSPPPQGRFPVPEPPLYRGRSSTVPPNEPPPPPPPPPGGGAEDLRPRVVTIKSPSAEIIEYWKSQGYVIVPGLKSPEGFGQMVRGDLADLYTNAEKPRPPVVTSDAPAPTPSTGPEIPGPFSGGRTQAGDVVPIPRKNVNESLIAKMRENGYEMAEENGAYRLFRRIITEDQGAINVEDEPFVRMFRYLQRMMRRDPTPEEVTTALQRQRRPTEEAGRVAPFQSRYELDVEDLHAKARARGIPNPEDIEPGELAHILETGPDPYNNATLPPTTYLPKGGPVDEEALAWRYLNLTDPEGYEYARATNQIPMIPSGMTVEEVQAAIEEAEAAEEFPDFMEGPETSPWNTPELGPEVPPEGGRVLSPVFGPGPLGSMEPLPPGQPTIEELQKFHDEQFGDLVKPPVQEVEPEPPSRGRGVFMPREGGGRLVRSGPGTILPGYDKPVPPTMGQQELPILRTQNRLEDIANAPQEEIDLRPPSTMEPQPVQEPLFTEPDEGLQEMAGRGPKTRQEKIVDTLRRGLPKASGWMDTRFLLPDGTRLSHREDIHAEATDKFGIDLDDAISSGVIRIAEGFDGAQIGAPISQRQSEILADAPHYTGRTLFIDVNTPGGLEVNTFGEDSEPDQIYRWVNDQFRNIRDREQGMAANPYPPGSEHAEIYTATRELRRQAGEAMKAGNMSDFVKLAGDAEKLEKILRDMPPPRQPRVPKGDPLDAIFGGRQEPWTPRVGDTYQTRMKRKELAALNDKMNEAIERLGPDSEVMDVLSPEDARRYDELMANLNEIDAGGSAMAVDPETGLAEVSFDKESQIQQLTKGYNKPTPFVMFREGMQNFLDAIKKLGTSGRATIKLVGKSGYGGQAQPAYIEMQDNGPGMTREQMFTVYIDLYRSGKTGDPDSTGGKGVGKAVNLFGGAHFEVETVTMMPNGQKIKSSFSGTPLQLMGKFPIDSVEVPFKTPTGTRFRTTLKDNQTIEQSKDALNMIRDYSRDQLGEITVDYGPNAAAKPELLDLKGNPKDKQLGIDVAIDGPNNKADIFVPDKAVKGSFGSVNVHVLNNGMWQFEKPMYLGESVNGIPNEVVVNLKPQVNEKHDDYAFPVQRESVLDKVWNDIELAVKRNVINPFSKGKQKDLAKLWAQMPITPAGAVDNIRESVVFDNGDRLTPKELERIVNSPAVKELQKIIDRFLDDILVKRGEQYDQDKLVRTGIYMPKDSWLYGHHIPNPNAPKAESAIFINFFGHLIANPDDPWLAAMETMETILHEWGHIGIDTPPRVNVPMAEEDLNDPRVGRYLSTLLNELFTQSGLDWGHGLDFSRRLVLGYVTIGTRTALQWADAIEHVYTGGKPTGGKPGEVGRYSTEIQELLHIYKESRRRPATSEDILSPTGVKHQDPRPPTADDIPGDNPADGDRTPPRSRWARVKDVTGWGRGGSQQSDKEYGWIREALAVSKNATTMLDYSLVGRQGLPQFLTTEFWKGIFHGLRGISYQGMQQVNEGLKRYDIMQEPINEVTGEREKSFAAREMGIELLTPASEMGARQEGSSSRWLEVGIGEGPIATAYKHTLGYPIRAWNRANLTFMNYLRVNRAQKLVDITRNMSVRALETGRGPVPGLLGGIQLRSGKNIGFTKKYSQQEAMDTNPYHNKLLARELGDLVRTATGQAPYKLHYLPHKNTQLNLEKAATILSTGMFSPGMFFSRARLLTPFTYVMATPFVRKQYLKALLSWAAGWYVVTELLKNAVSKDDRTVEINNDPTSADLGKVRVGDIRADAGGGGLQFLTLYGRLYMGGSTSSASGEFHRSGTGYQAQTTKDIMERFMVNKLDPTFKFAYDLANASEYNPFHVGDRTLQLFVTLTAQDLYEIYKEDPDLLPRLAPGVFLGTGTQIYEKGESVGKLIPTENDWNVTGGGLRDIMPWNWQADPSEYRNFPWQEKE